MASQTSLELDGGYQIPAVGFGTWEVTGDAVYPALRTAIDVGYRHIDTAYGYENEAEIGRTLRDCGVDRESLFLTTKLPPWRVSFEQETLDGSLSKLGTDYLDLWLIHAPPPEEQIPALWEFFIKAREQGKVRSIGVSNFSTAQIDALVTATGVMPAVNQIRWSPGLFDEQRLVDSHERNIRLEGFSAVRLTDLRDPTLVKIAENHGVTTAQVLLRWHLEHGVVCLPRSTKPSRIEENFDLWQFELTSNEVAVIDAMGLAG